MADYFRQIFQTIEFRRELLDKAVKTLSQYDFDTIVVRGTSGTTVGSMLAVLMDKHLAVVRKPAEGSHCPHKVSGWVGKRWVIVDDFVASGETVREIVQGVKELPEFEPETQPIEFTGRPFKRSESVCVGFYGYTPFWDRKLEDYRSTYEQKLNDMGVSILEYDRQAEPRARRYAEFEIMEVSVPSDDTIVKTLQDKLAKANSEAEIAF